ncbi:MAG: hypothetical protein EXS31_18310 [Pedosphaera sp.]|nr:hypothetical protein [Pedosphaera sp.]
MAVNKLNPDTRRLLEENNFETESLPERRDLQGLLRQGVLRPAQEDEAAHYWTEGSGRFHNEDMLITSGKRRIAMSNQWSKATVNVFYASARKLGLEIFDIN